MEVLPESGCTTRPTRASPELMHRGQADPPELANPTSGGAPDGQSGPAAQAGKQR